MPRLTISLPKSVYDRLSLIASENNDSMSSAINRLVSLGMHYAEADYQHSQIEQHCHHLIIQMNALIKNMSAEMLKFSQEDFEELRRAASLKYNEILEADSSN